MSMFSNVINKLFDRVFIVSVTWVSSFMVSNKNDNEVEHPKCITLQVYI